MKTPFSRPVSRASLAAAFAAVLAMSTSLPAQAAGDALDQSQTLTLSFQRQVAFVAQTFTPAKSGGIDRVSLASDTTGGFASVQIMIETVTSAGAPSGTVLGTTSYAGSLGCCRQFHDYAFNPAVAVSSGTKYAIVVHVVAGIFTWYTSSVVDAYLGGQLYLSCSGCAWVTGSQWGQDFAFETWVATSVNQPPAVAADTAAVSTSEGTAPTNTGTFSDPDGDTVALSASTGTVTRTGTGSGTWAWTQPAADEGPAENVTVTADDGHGHTTTASFTVTVNAVAPTATILTDPLTAPEGTAVPFTGGATSRDAQDTAAGFAYSWHVTKNGSSFATGSGASFSFTPDDEGTFVVTFQATDDGNMSGSDSTTVVGTNVAPTAHVTGVSASAPLVLTPNETVTFSGNFSDPGALDSHTVTWNFGDGSTATTNYGTGASASFSSTHSYAAAGAYNVTLTVGDDDGGVGQASTHVTVQTAEQALSSVAARVQGLSNLTAGQRNSLTAHLNAASASASRGDNTAANNQLNAFLNELQAYVKTGKVSPADASTLRLAVHAIQSALGTFNRFLEWWPLEA